MYSMIYRAIDDAGNEYQGPWFFDQAAPPRMRDCLREVPGFQEGLIRSPYGVSYRLTFDPHTSRLWV